MFNTDVAEYVRLSYDTLEDACRAHADAAVRLARWNTMFRVATLATTGVAAFVAVGAASWRPSWFLASAVFEHVAPADRYTFEIARRALGSRSGAPAAPAVSAAA